MSVMEKKYSNFKDRQAQRNKAFWIFLVIGISIALVGSALLFFMKWLYGIFIPIVTFGFFFGFIYEQTRPWAIETFETKIFVNFYEASELLGHCSEEDEKFDFHSKKAYNKAKKATSKISNFSAGFDNSRSKLLKNQIGKPLNNLVKNLETRILPRITQKGNIFEMQSVLSGLAQLFSEAHKPLTLKDIISKNVDLARYDTVENEEITFKFRSILSREPIKILLSFLSSFGITTIGVLVHSYLFQTDLWVAFGDLGTFITYLIGWLAFGLAIYAILRKKS